MSDICTDNRFELVAKYKAKLIETTNIETSADEMTVIDNILFRMWQMGWLDRLEQPTVDAVPVVRCRECKWAEVDAWWTYCKLGHKEDTTNSIIYTCTYDFYCADGERKDGERRTE